MNRNTRRDSIWQQVRADCYKVDLRFVGYKNNLGHSSLLSNLVNDTIMYQIQNAMLFPIRTMVCSQVSHKIINQVEKGYESAL